MFLSLKTKNLNWEILTKNLFTFKRWDGVKDENIMKVYWKTKGWGGGGHKKPRCKGELP